MTKKKFEFLYKKIKNLDNKLLAIYENEELKNRTGVRDKENHVASRHRNESHGQYNRSPSRSNNISLENTVRLKQILEEKDRQYRELLSNVDKQIQQIVQDNEVKIQKILHENSGKLKSAIKKFDGFERSLADIQRDMADLQDDDRVRALDLHKLYDCQIESVMASVSQRTNETLKQIQATLSTNRASSTDDLHARKFDQKAAEFNESIENRIKLVGENLNEKLKQVESSLKDNVTDSKLEHEKCWNLLEAKIEEMNSVIVKQQAQISLLEQEKLKSNLENDNRIKSYESHIKSLVERLDAMEEHAAMSHHKTAEIDSQVSLLAQAVIRLHEDRMQHGEILGNEYEIHNEDDLRSSSMRPYINSNSLSKLPIIPEMEDEDNIEQRTTNDNTHVDKNGPIHVVDVSFDGEEDEV